MDEIKFRANNHNSQNSRSLAYKQLQKMCLPFNDSKLIKVPKKQIIKSIVKLGKNPKKTFNETIAVYKINCLGW